MVNMENFDTEENVDLPNTNRVLSKGANVSLFKDGNIYVVTVSFRSKITQNLYRGQANDICLEKALEQACLDLLMSRSLYMTFSYTNDEFSDQMM